MRRHRTLTGVCVALIALGGAPARAASGDEERPPTQLWHSFPLDPQVDERVPPAPLIGGTRISPDESGVAGATATLTRDQLLVQSLHNDSAGGTTLLLVALVNGGLLLLAAVVALRRVL